MAASNIKCNGMEGNRYKITEDNATAGMVAIEERLGEKGGAPFGRALKKVPVFGKTNKKAASYCTSEQFSDGQILNLFCLTQWLR